MANFSTKGYIADTFRPIWSQGDKRQVVAAVAEIVVATADADTFILARNLPVSTILQRIVFPKGSAGLTGATDYDIGIYKTSDGDDLGTVLDVDAFVNGRDFSVAIDAGEDINEADATQTIADLLSISSSEAHTGGVHIVLTCNTAGSEAQDLDMDIVLIMAG